MHDFPVVDLFSGVGGFSLGAARAGFRVHGSVELDAHAHAAHDKNFPTTLHWQKDISKITASSFFKHFDLSRGELVGLIGGPPCQGFSAIGKNDLRDPRRLLFSKFFALVNDIRPKFFLAENVPGILDEKHVGVIKSALQMVPDEYVVLPHMRISAHDYGAPTTRTRIFFFGYNPSFFSALSPDNFLPPKSTEKVLVKDALAGLPKKINPSWQTEEQSWQKVKYPEGKAYYTERLCGHIPPGIGDPEAIKKLRTASLVSGFLGTHHSVSVAARYAAIPQGRSDQVSKSKKLVPNGFCGTLRAGTGPDKGSFQAVRPLHPTEPRVITPREGARLQGFPDWFQFAPTKWHSFRQIGNSVSPILAEYLLSVIKTAYIRKGSA